MKVKRRRKGRKGQVMVLAAVMVVVLGGMVALTVDLGQVFAWRARLQNAADAAALAGIRVLVGQRLASQPEQHGRTAALAEATLIQQANASAAGMNLEFGRMQPDGTFLPVDTGTNATAVRATTFRNGEAPGGAVRLSFAPLVGMKSCQVAAAAIAEVTANIRGVLFGLMPFAVPQDRIVPPGQTMVFYPADGEAYDGLGDLTVVPGCWGLLNLDGGALSTSELVDWILNGYSAIFDVSDDGYIWIDGTSGFRAALQQPMRTKIGDVIVLVVYDQVIGQGSNAMFRCVGFLLGTLTDVKLTGQNAHISCRVEAVKLLHDIVSGGNQPSLNILKIQLIR